MQPFDRQGTFSPIVPAASHALRRLTLKSAGATVFYGLLRLLIQMVGTVVLARIISPRDYGVVSLVSTLGLLLSGSSSNGLPEAIAQSRELNRQLASNLFWIHSSLGLLLTLGFAACGPLVAGFYGEPQLAALVAGFAVSIGLSYLPIVHLSLLRRAMQFTHVAHIEIVSRAFSIAVSIYGACAGWGVWALVAGFSALPLATAAGAWLGCRWLPGRPRREGHTLPLIRFALHSYGRFNINYLTTNSDNLLIGWRFGPGTLGFYKRAYDLFTLPATQLVSTTTLVAVTALSRVRDDRERFRRALLGAAAVVAFLGMGIAGLFTLIGRDLIRLLLGPGWEQAGLIFTFFAPGIGMMLVYGMHSWIHLSLGRADRWLRWGLVELTSTLLLFLVGLHWGPEGVAIAWGLSYWLLTPAALHYAGKPIGLGVGAVAAVVWRYLAAALATTLALFCLLPRCPALALAAGSPGAALRLGLLTPTFALLYLAAIVLFHGGPAPLVRLAGLVRELVGRDRN